jgi:hypothetical protein
VAQPQHPLAGDGHGRRRARPLHRVQRRRPQAAPPRPATPCGCRRRRRQRLEASPLLALDQMMNALSNRIISDLLP